MTHKSFTQAAGFLRIRDGASALDRCAIHPEHYAVVERISAKAGVAPDELLGNREALERVNLDELDGSGVGLRALRDILEELRRPGMDPRGPFTQPRSRSNTGRVAELTEGMTLEGTVTNVTNFGAFVDIGVDQDGLVHLSQMSNRFIRDPREAVAVGDVVSVKVLSVEAGTGRIGLSMKALLPAIPRRRRKPERLKERRSATGPGTDAGAARGESGAHPAGRERGRVRHGRVPRRRSDPRRQADVAVPAAAGQDLPPAEVTAEPPPPEQTMQEKIAILRSKFKGIR
jgi:uncharacterized protein